MEETVINVFVMIAIQIGSMFVGYIVGNTRANIKNIDVYTKGYEDAKKKEYDPFTVINH